MGSILQPGYVRWDGFKYVLDPSVEIVGPAGAQGAPGAAGSPGPQGATGSPGSQGAAGNAALVYQPGGTPNPSEPNVYTSWTTLMGNRLNTPDVPMTIIIDDHFVANNFSTATITPSSDGATLPQSTINVDSNFGFPSSGVVIVQADVGPQPVSYTGITGTAFLNCFGGTGTINTGNLVSAPGGAVIDQGGWELNKNTAIVGSRSSPPPTLTGGSGSFPYPVGNGTNSQSTLIIPSGAFLYDPSYFQDLTIYGWPASNDHSMLAVNFATIDISFRDCWVVSPGTSHFGPSGNVINIQGGSTINAYGWTLFDGFDSNNYIFDCPDTTAGNQTFYFNMCDESFLNSFTIVTTNENPQSIIYANVADGGANFNQQSNVSINVTTNGGNFGIGWPGYQGGDFASGYWSAASAGQVLTMSTQYKALWQTPSSGSVLPTLVFKPGGSTSGIVYNTWASLMIARNTIPGPVTIIIDDTITSPAVIPAGTYNFTPVVGTGSAADCSTKLVGANGNVATLTVLNIANGAVIQNPSSFENLNITGLNTSSTIFQPNGVVYLPISANNTIFQAGSTGNLFNVPNGTIDLYGNSQFFLSGAGGHIISAASGGNVVINIHDNVLIQGNTLAVTNGSLTIYTIDPGAFWSTTQTATTVTIVGANTYVSGTTAGTLMSIYPTETVFAAATSIHVDSFVQAITQAGTSAFANLVSIPVTSGSVDVAISIIGVDNASATGVYRGDLTFTAIASGGSLNTVLPTTPVAAVNTRSNGSLASVASQVTSSGNNVIIQVNVASGTTVKWSVIVQLQWRQ